MRILCIGDIVGRSGRELLCETLPTLRKQQQLDMVLVNAENAAAGFGLTARIAAELFEAGADVLTLGNHAWDQADIVPYIAQQPRLVRALNYRAKTPGQGASIITTKTGKRVLVSQVLLRVFMSAVECPFEALDSLLAQQRLGQQVDAILIDMHGEATSEKQCLGFHLDGRVSAVFGTHTHVPTADTRILPKGTGYQSDLGMSGDYQSVIGFSAPTAIARMINDTPQGRLTVATGAASLAGMTLHLNDKGLCRAARPYRTGPDLQNTTEMAWDC